uniref:Uncharacterized protein n=1 Tax=Anguilla anguilla TaxID=7936 RepID=A0A0E9TBP7_ANGAN
MPFTTSCTLHNDNSRFLCDSRFLLLCIGRIDRSVVNTVADSFGAAVLPL